MDESNGRKILWTHFVSERVGTALLVLVGLLLVILMFGTGTPMVCLITGEGLRSLITGFLEAALKLGATTEEIMEVLKVCVAQGVQASNLGVPILAKNWRFSITL